MLNVQYIFTICSMYSILKNTNLSNNKVSIIELMSLKKILTTIYLHTNGMRVLPLQTTNSYQYISLFWKTSREF